MVFNKIVHRGRDMFHVVLTHQNAYIINELSRCYRNGDLALITGAGVSKGCGLSDWNDLRADLLKDVLDSSYEEPGKPNGWEITISQHIERILDSASPLVMGRYLKTKLGERYLSTLRDALYKKPLNRSLTLQAMAILADLRAVCTYNYDDLLETQPNPPRPFCSVAEPSDRAPNDQIPVYHVHGLLPSNSNLSPRGDVILSEEDYHRVYRDAFHWSNTVQLTVLRQFSVLLVGLSLSDPNLRRLLDITKDENIGAKRVAVMRSPQDPPDSHGAYIFHFITKELEEEALASIGLSAYWVNDYDKDIPLLLNSIAAADPIRYYIRGLLKNLEPQSDIRDSIETCHVRTCTDKALRGQLFCPVHYRRKMILEYIGLTVAVQYLDNDTLTCLGDEEIKNAWKLVKDSQMSDPFKGFLPLIDSPDNIEFEQSTTADAVIKFKRLYYKS